MTPGELNMAELLRKIDELETRVQELEDLRDPFEYIEEYILPPIRQNVARAVNTGLEVAALTDKVHVIEAELSELRKLSQGDLK